MSADAKTVSEREAVLRERKAYARGRIEAPIIWGEPRQEVKRMADAFAAKIFPLPTVTRPRVVTLTRCDHCSPMQFRFVDDKLEWREADVPSEWKRCDGELYLSSPAFLIELGKLAANPTEEIAE